MSDISEQHAADYYGELGRLANERDRYKQAAEEMADTLTQIRQLLIYTNQRIPRAETLIDDVLTAYSKLKEELAPKSRTR